MQLVFMTLYCSKFFGHPYDPNSESLANPVFQTDDDSAGADDGDDVDDGDFHEC